MNERYSIITRYLAFKDEEKTEEKLNIYKEKWQDLEEKIKVNNMRIFQMMI